MMAVSKFYKVISPSGAKWSEINKTNRLKTQRNEISRGVTEVHYKLIHQIRDRGLNSSLKGNSDFIVASCLNNARVYMIIRVLTVNCIKYNSVSYTQGWKFLYALIQSQTRLRQLPNPL